MAVGTVVCLRVSVFIACAFNNYLTVFGSLIKDFALSFLHVISLSAVGKPHMAKKGTGGLWMDVCGVHR
jgi:hypothetical protein